jgi:hypothetical protein
VAGGRRGYRLGVAPGEPIWGAMFVADDVVVDAEYGILLRSTSHAGSRPVEVASLIARQAARDARSAVRSVLGVIRGEDKP